MKSVGDVKDGSCRGIFNQMARFLLKAYKAGVSPWLPRACRFVPSCSDYARECYERHAFARATRLTFSRLLRCHPLCAGGFDPPPYR